MTVTSVDCFFFAMRPSSCCEGLGEFGHQIQDRHIKEDNGPALFGAEPLLHIIARLGVKSGERCQPLAMLKHGDHTAGNFRDLVKIAQIASLRKRTVQHNRGGILWY